MSTNRPPNFDDLTPEELKRGDRRLRHMFTGTPVPDAPAEHKSLPFSDDALRNMMRSVSKQLRTADFWMMSLPNSEENALAAALSAADSGIEVLIHMGAELAVVQAKLRRTTTEPSSAPLADDELPDEVETFELNIPGMPENRSIADVAVFEWIKSACPVVTHEDRWPLLAGRMPRTASESETFATTLAACSADSGAAAPPVISATADGLVWKLSSEGSLAVETVHSDDFLAVEMETQTTDGIHSVRSVISMTGSNAKRSGEKALHPPQVLASDRVRISVGPCKPRDLGLLNSIDRKRFLTGREEAVVVCHRNSRTTFELTAHMSHFGHLIANSNAAVGLRVLEQSGGVR